MQWYDLLMSGDDFNNRLLGIMTLRLTSALSAVLADMLILVHILMWQQLNHTMNAMTMPCAHAPTMLKAFMFNHV